MDASIINYDSSQNLLRVNVDQPPHDVHIIFSELIEHVFSTEINQLSGALIAFELHVVPWDADWWINSHDLATLKYDEETDALLIDLTMGRYDKEKKWDTDVAQAGLCDLVWRDHQDMISLNRNDVGNLIGIELLGLNGIVEKFRS